MKEIILLNAVTVIGAGAVKIPLESFQNWSCQINVTGSPTEVIVALEGNIEGAVFGTMQAHTLSAAELSAQQANFVIIGMPANQIRGNLVILTGGTNPTVSMICVGVK